MANPKPKLSIHCIQTINVPPIPNPLPASCIGQTSVPTKASSQPLIKDTFMSISNKFEEERARDRAKQQEKFRNERTKELETFERELKNKLKLPP